MSAAPRSEPPNAAVAELTGFALDPPRENPDIMAPSGAEAEVETAAVEVGAPNNEDCCVALPNNEGAPEEAAIPKSDGAAAAELVAPPNGCDAAGADEAAAPNSDVEAVDVGIEPKSEGGLLTDEVPSSGEAPKSGAEEAAVVDPAERSPNRLGAADAAPVVAAPNKDPDTAVLGTAVLGTAVCPKSELFGAPPAAVAVIGAPDSNGDTPAAGFTPAGAPRRLELAVTPRAADTPPVGATVENVPIRPEKPGSVFATLTAGAAVPRETGTLAFETIA